MKGDFSRFTFDRNKHYARVLLQQGRVQLDADWNEQGAILLHRLQTMARDLIGPFGGPAAECGFQIALDADKTDFTIGRGRYYVNGVLCENDRDDVTYTRQPMRPARDEKLKPAEYLVYLDAWEEYVNASEDPDIREKALGGSDTAGRSRIAWAVRLLSFADVKPLFKDPSQPPCENLSKHWAAISNLLQSPNRGALRVKAERLETADDTPCVVSPSARYRGRENQLYRIEIHSGGKAAKPSMKAGKGAGPQAATFKWSRENGSVIFPVASVTGQVFALEGLGGDSTLGLGLKHWVELVDDDRSAEARAEPLLQVTFVDPVKMEVTVQTAVGTVDPLKHPYLRRWDQKQGAENKGGLTLHEGAAVVVENTWLSIEDGIEIRFEPAKDDHVYRPGDFWYIPARTADEGTIYWPAAVPPDGVTHNYAPLGIMLFTAAGEFDPQFNCVKTF